MRVLVAFLVLAAVLGLGAGSAGAQLNPCIRVVVGQGDDQHLPTGRGERMQASGSVERAVGRQRLGAVTTSNLVGGEGD